MDVNAHVLVKGEYHRFDGTYNLSPTENPGGFDPNWDLFAVKATLHF